jgi:hypothetical protein
VVREQISAPNNELSRDPARDEVVTNETIRGISALRLHRHPGRDHVREIAHLVDRRPPTHPAAPRSSESELFEGGVFELLDYGAERRDVLVISSHIDQSALHVCYDHKNEPSPPTSGLQRLLRR